MDLTEKERRVLERYRKRALTRKEAAKLLHMSERQVNRCLRLEGAERVESESKLLRTEAANRRLAREAAAKAVHEGHLTIAEAAIRAGCSVRTIYRHLKQFE